METALMRVSDGQEAIAYLEGKGEFADRKKYSYPTPLLLDLWMPKLNGMEVLKWVRAQPAYYALLIFMLTFEESEEISVRAYYPAVNLPDSQAKRFR